jgi:hypothetical protein
MTNKESNMDDFDFDPTEADLAEVEDDLTLDDLAEDEAEELFPEDDYAAVDDRWGSDGIPSWSAWA